TEGAELIAPTTLHAEIGNAFSAMLKRRRMTLDTALQALEAFHKIPVRVSEIAINDAVKLAASLGIYAYDAYMIACAHKHRCPLISLDAGLVEAAHRAGVETIEVSS
ncbi:MAG TPA: type II toxin-antitoxin system VapC family toxin, partial [Rhodothermales bacterium]